MSEVADAKIHGHGVARRVHTVHRSSEEGGEAPLTHTHTLPRPDTREHRTVRETH